MGKGKTREQKLQAEIRKLKQENDYLKENNEKLISKLEEITQSSKTEIARQSKIKHTILYVYDVVVSSVILVFVYWIAIMGYDDFDLPYVFLMILVVLIAMKSLVDNREFHIKKILQVILSDLLKPFGAMLLGLFLFMLSLGEEWRKALNFAKDSATMGILIFTVIFVIIAIVFLSYVLIGIRKIFTKRKSKKKQ